MTPNIPGAADAFAVVTEQVGGMDLTEVRGALEKLLERRLLAPLSAADRLLWGQLIAREQELLERPAPVGEPRP